MLLERWYERFSPSWEDPQTLAFSKDPMDLHCTSVHDDTHGRRSGRPAI